MIALTLLFFMMPFLLVAEHLQRWQRLDPVEQNLRRCHGFVLVLFALLSPFIFYGSRGIGGFLVYLVIGKVWPIAVFVIVIGYGLVRGIAGARRLAGARDGMRWAGALVRFCIAGAVTVYLWRAYPWQDWGVSGFGVDAMQLVVAAALWQALAGLVRMIVLLLPASSAVAAVEVDIERHRHRWGDHQ